MIAITGANGNLGKATIQHLLKKTPPSNIVAIVREPQTMQDFQQLGIVVRKADYNDYNSLQAAFKNVETALQISTIGVDIETANKQEENVVNAMAQNKVKHIAYTSMVKAGPNAIFNGTATHYRSEQLIKKTNIPFTFFRNSMYMQYIPDLIGNALQSGEIRYPSGNGKVSFVSRMDIAEAIANVLIQNTHENQVYEITGTKAYTFDELAQLVNARYIDIADSAFREELASYQLPLPVIDLLASLASAIRAGEFSYTADTLEKLLGRKPLGLEEYIKELLLR